MANLFNSDYLHHLASKYGLAPSKKYGQNYLIDEEVINKILEIANISKGDTVVEVGPGFGVLTFPLAEGAGRVIGFEIEKKLQPYWDEKILNFKNIEVIWGNVLREFPVIASEAKQSSPSGKDRHVASLLAMARYKVVANLPYQITSAVIRLFLESPNPPELMVLMVQKEVGERICAEPGDMSLLSVSVQYYAEPKLEFVVPRASFWPSPRVDSAVITIKPESVGAQEQFETDQFFNLVKAGFANRRKLLLKNLEPIVGKKNKEQLKKIFSELGLLPTVRAQELSVSEWKELFIHLPS